jgi:hypothetical protein
VTDLFRGAFLLCMGARLDRVRVSCDLPKYDQTFTELAIVESKAFFYRHGMNLGKITAPRMSGLIVLVAACKNGFTLLSVQA